jgi:hypothetical protein
LGTIEMRSAAPADVEPTPGDPDVGGGAGGTARAAMVAFVAALVVAAPVLLWLGNQRWFSTDEWGFLVSYSLDDPGGLFAPQNGHWSTLPVVAFQVLFETVGLRSYAAYQVMSVTTHVLAVVVVRAVMRRAGVRPWVATLAALSLLLFGNGQQNIFVAIQITYVGAFVLGVCQFLLADHDGRVSWRDGLGVLAGVAALMCSAVGVAMIPVVAVAVLLRRGWRVAALHVVPVVAAYGVWFVFERPTTTMGETDAGLAEALGNIVRWDVLGEAGTFAGLAANPWAGALLAVVLIVGLVVAWRGRSWSWFRRTQGGPVALLVGGLSFLTLTGASRWMLADADAVGSQSRYLYMVGAFTIPALAIAFDALALRWRVAVPALAGLFAIGLVGNLLVFREPSTFVGLSWDHRRDVVVAAARSPLAPSVSRNLRVDPFASFALDIGWLLDAQRDGKLPDPAPIDPNTEAEIPVRLGLRQGLFGVNPANCERIEQVTITPAKGAMHRIVPAPGADIGVRTVDAAGEPTSPEVTFVGSQGRYFTAELADQRFSIRSTVPGSELEVCS